MVTKSKNWRLTNRNSQNLTAKKRIMDCKEKNNKAALDYLRDLGEKKAKSLKVAFELTETQLDFIMKLHQKRALEDQNIMQKLMTDKKLTRQ